MDHCKKHQAEQAARIYGSYNKETQQASEEELEKSATDYFEKGRKAAPGEVRKFGGVDYIKTANGWRKVGKKGGKAKDVHDTIHGSKEIAQTRSGKSIYRGQSASKYKDFSRDDHMDAAAEYHKISSKQTTDHSDADEDIVQLLNEHRKAGGDKDDTYINVIGHANKYKVGFAAEEMKKKK